MQRPVCRLFFIPTFFIPNEIYCEKALRFCNFYLHLQSCTGEIV